MIEIQVKLSEVHGVVSSLFKYWSATDSALCSGFRYKLRFLGIVWLDEL